MNILLLASATLSLAGHAPQAKGHLPPLSVQGPNMVDPSGKTITLKGANLGNWHVIEFWMLSLAGENGVPGDQYLFEELLTKRFGAKEKDRLMELYRSSWITDRDFANLQKYGFNLVRLPMNYRLMEDDARPFHLRRDAWKWIDRAVDMAEKHGMYVILDMHGAQGGQSPYDHTGRSNQNKLKDSLEDQNRLAWLWSKLAERYRTRSAVVAYDVMNEPYGTPKPLQVSIFQKAYESIRKQDPNKLIFAHGNYDDFFHYGNPKDHGWKNVGFQMHYYPGLFGGGSPTIKTHNNHIESLKTIAEKINALQVPFLIGEMNVVFDKAGGADMMRRYFDLHASYGWMTTMWAYKTINREGGVQSANWGAVLNAEPSKVINFETASKEEINAYIANFATQKLMFNEPLLKAITDPTYVAKTFEAPPKRKVAPSGELATWTQVDIGGALKGGFESLGGDGFALYGGGKDIWGKEDDFRFLYQPWEGDGTIEVTLNGIEDIDTYTKAGLMIRSDLTPDAANVLLSVFPSGDVQLAHRDSAGGDTAGFDAKPSALPGVTLRLTRKGGKISGAFRKGDGPWTDLQTIDDKLPRRVFVGAVSLSHSADELVKITYANLKVKE